MKRLHIVLMALFLGFCASAQENPFKWDASIKHLKGDIYEITLTGTASSEGWHIYDCGPYENGPIATSVTVEGAATAEGGPEFLSKVNTQWDDIFEMNIGEAENPVISQKIRLTGKEPGKAEVSIEWQSCRGGMCIAPDEAQFSFEVPAASAGSGSADKSGASFSWSLIFSAIGWGLLMLLTPCVFPMVPMTVSFFLKKNQGEGGGKGRGRFLATMFGLFIVGLYTLPIAVIILITYFAGGEAVTADIFNWLATHWLPNILFFVIFMVFAASFFGAFEIVLPSKWVNGSDQRSERAGLGGVFFLALTLVLVSFSCTGPIVGTVLIQSTTGGVWAPIVTMVAFSVAFALPFTIFAFAPSLLGRLPKSGGWLNSVKVVLGFVEIALGLKFLSVADQTYHWGILDREVYLAVWIVVFSLLGFYLLGKLKFKYDSELKHIGVLRLALAIITFSFVVYMVPGMWGAPLKALSGYLPPMNTQDFKIEKYAGPSAAGSRTEGQDPQAVYGFTPKYSEFLRQPEGFSALFDYDEAMEYARKAGKPLFLDFTGGGCVNCREMEARVFSDPRVSALLRDRYVVVQIYGDDKTVLPEEEWVQHPVTGKTLKSLGKINSYMMASRYGVNAQPFYVLIDPESGETLSTRAYDLDVEGFIRFLSEALK